MLEKPLELKLRPASALPAHPELAPEQKSAPDGVDFANAVLEKVLELVDIVIPKWFKKHGTKSSSPATGKVEVFSGHAIEGGTEWFGRRSVHKNEDATGTATWAQLDNALRKDHSVHEGDYTPNIFDANKLLDWDLSTAPERDGGMFKEISMSLWEMYHQIPFPLANRVFHTLVITTKYEDQGFIVAQLPVTLTGFPSSVLERSHMDLAKKKYRTKQSDGSWKLESSLVEGKYVSVERVKVNTDNTVVWEMATASDPAGHIPEFITNHALPGEVAKDVGYVMGWIDKQREKS